MSRPHHYTLTFSCPDRVGIVARVTGFFAGLGGWILSSSQHADADSARYFMRIEVKADSLPFDHAELRRRFAPLAAEFDMDWRISDSAVKRRVLLMVSTQEHCLYDLLARWQSKELDMDIIKALAGASDVVVKLAATSELIVHIEASKPIPEDTYARVRETTSGETDWETVDPTGHATFAGLKPDGKYVVSVEVSFEGEASSQIGVARDVRGDAKTLELKLTSGLSVTGRIRLPVGATNVRIVATMDGNGRGGTVEEDGRYTVGGLTAGPCEVSAYARSADGKHLRASATVEAGGTVDLDLDRGR